MPRRSRSRIPTRMPRCPRTRARPPISTAMNGHYWNRNEREKYETHRDTLLELISKARSAETPEALAAMQTDADEVLREALDCYEDGAIEESDLSVIGLALQQFQNAVTDRRAIIGGASDLVRKRAI